MFCPHSDDPTSRVRPEIWSAIRVHKEPDVSPEATPEMQFSALAVAFAHLI